MPAGPSACRGRWRGRRSCCRVSRLSPSAGRMPASSAPAASRAPLDAHSSACGVNPAASTVTRTARCSAPDRVQISIAPGPKLATLSGLFPRPVGGRARYCVQVEPERRRWAEAHADDVVPDRSQAAAGWPARPGQGLASRTGQGESRRLVCAHPQRRAYSTDSRYVPLCATWTRDPSTVSPGVRSRRARL